jgi:hypothetical protein
LGRVELAGVAECLVEARRELAILVEGGHVQEYSVNGER